MNSRSWPLGRRRFDNVTEHRVYGRYRNERERMTFCASFLLTVTPKLSVVKCMVKHDDYMTPFSAWEDVSFLHPSPPHPLGSLLRRRHVWCPPDQARFRCHPRGRRLLQHDLGECVVTNPPFSELPRVLARLRELGKPFVVIIPCSTLTTRYFGTCSRTSR